MDGFDLDLLKTLFNRRLDSHKYDFGHVLVIGGSPGMVGAPLLVAQAALRTGAGLVTIAAAPDVVAKLEKRVEEVMTLRLPDNNATDGVIRFINQRKVKSVVIGPGLTDNSADSVKALLAKLELPVVLDAGGLTAVTGGGLADISKHNHAVVITPHDGELSKLLGEHVPSALNERQNLVLQKAGQWGVCLVLKGHPSLVAADKHVYQNPTGNPGLASAGTGDVLSGVIASLLGQAWPVLAAARFGSYLHGLAGDLAVADKTQPGLIASDVIEYLPVALQAVHTKLNAGNF